MNRIFEYKDMLIDISSINCITKPRSNVVYYYFGVLIGGTWVYIDELRTLGEAVMVYDSIYERWKDFLNQSNKENSINQSI